VFGLMAVGALFAVGAAQAEVRAVSLKKASDTMFTTTLPVSDSVTGVLNQRVLVDGWALIDQEKCVQIGAPQFFKMSHTDSNGTWQMYTIRRVLGDGACAGQSFYFSAISFTQTGGTSGSTYNVNLRAAFTAVQKLYREELGSGRRVAITDHIAVTLQ